MHWLKTRESLQLSRHKHQPLHDVILSQYHDVQEETQRCQTILFNSHREFYSLVLICLMSDLSQKAILTFSSSSNPSLHPYTLQFILISHVSRVPAHIIHTFVPLPSASSIFIIPIHPALFQKQSCDPANAFGISNLKRTKKNNKQRKKILIEEKGGYGYILHRLLLIDT